MKKLLIPFLMLLSPYTFSCGGPYYWDGMSFYNLFAQTNISAEEYYPFLKTTDPFFRSTYIEEKNKSGFPVGNSLLWQQLLTGWSIDDIEKAVYGNQAFNWDHKTRDIEIRAKKYIEFARECSETFSYRFNQNSWDFDIIAHQPEIDTEALLAKANQLLHEETNQQLKARYYYQLIRIFHYSKLWSDAILVYENKIEDQFPKNEIYYYIVDQVAGCYYSTENYDKAAYLFTKVVNHSYDRKKSAFTSYNFCINKGFEGRSYFKSIDDKKDLLLIKSLQTFSDRASTIDEFMALDANDKRIELLFMRLLNTAERLVWPKNIGLSEKSLPFVEDPEKIEQLIAIAQQQLTNPVVKNNDFWMLASSYLYFINQDINKAISMLQKVKTYKEQVKKLSSVYMVFSWDKITFENENKLTAIINDNPEFNWKNNRLWDAKYVWLYMILDKVSHTYYSEDQIAKAFLVHNNLELVNELYVPELLNDLEVFYYKKNKSDFEKNLLQNLANPQIDFIGYVYNQKGISFLYQQNPDSALYYFNKNKTYRNELDIPGLIFSNNTMESFSSPALQVMVDEVYKAKVFSFIKPSFSRKELAENLKKLNRLTQDSLQWKRKLANYLLGNYYFNICNTGYFRGLLNNRDNRKHRYYVGYDWEIHPDALAENQMIKKQSRI